MKKIFVSFLFLLTLILTVISASSCKMKCTEHIEEIDEAQAPTCTEDGYTEGKHCSVCNKVLVEREVIPARHTERILYAVAPTCTESGLTEGVECAVCYEVLVEQEAVPPTHTLVDDAPIHATCAPGITSGKHCSVCGHVEVAQMATEPIYLHKIGEDNVCVKCSAPASEGLDLTLSSDGEYYTVTGNGSFDGSYLLIPSKHEGLPVKAIGECAFVYSDRLETVVIPSSVEKIEASAFAYCEALRTVDFGDNISSIGQRAFYSCVGLCDLNLPEALVDIGGYAFYSCTSLSEAVIPKNVENIGEFSFAFKFFKSVFQFFT